MPRKELRGKGGARLASALVGAMLTVAGPASAQEWAPTKPVRIVVPYPAGGTSDMMARLIAPLLEKALHQPVVVENKTGGGGITGTEAVISSKADGHTLGIIASSHASGASLVKNLPFDPVKDIEPLTLVTRVPVALVVNPAFPAKSMQDLIAAAKAKPGSIPYGSAGNGLSGHFAGEAMKLSAHIEMIHVPYRGGAPGLTDVIAGQIPMMFNVVSSVLPAIQAGKVRPLAVTSKERSSVLPDVPTMAEAGIGGVEIYEWYGLVAPAGLAPDAKRRLHDELVKALATPEFSGPMKERGIEVISNTPDEFRAYLAAEVDRFAKLIKAAKITSD